MKDATESWWSNLDKLCFFILVFLLPTQFGKHFWPQFSVVSGQRIDYLSPTVYATDILVGILFLLSLFQKKINVHPLFSLALVFLSVSIFLSQSPIAGWYWLVKFLEMSFVLWYVSHSSIVNHKSSIVFIPLSVGVIFESFLALAQFLHQGSIGGLLYFLGERNFSAATPGIANASINGQLILRPYGTFSHPNVLAGYLLVSMLLCVCFWNKSKNSLYPVFLIGTFGLFLTFSRIAIFAWICSVIILIVFYKRQQIKHATLIVISCLLTGFLLLVLFFPQLISRFAFSLSDESVVVRQQLAESAVRMIVSHPFFGVGSNNFISSLPQFSGNSFVLQPVHSIFLLIAAELGIPGALLFIGFLLYVVRQLFFVRNAPLLLAFAAILFTGLFDHYWLTLQQGQLLFALVIGISFAVGRATIQR